ncbi:MAG: hypothetical protein ACOX4M_07150 [Acetivibrionales bacterium]|jgi:hypothetical protein
MNRLRKCVTISGRSMIRSSLAFTLIYLLGYAVLVSAILIIKNNESAVYFNSGYDIGAAIFAFVYVTSSYKEINNFLLMFGNTRRTIFQSKVVVNIAMCVILAFMSFLFIGIDSVQSGVLSPGPKLFRSSTNAIYPGAGIASEFIFTLALYILVTSFAMVYGSLVYKLGKLFIVTFWICFGMAFVLLPVIVDIYGIGDTLAMIIIMYLCIYMPNGIFLASANFIITALVLYGFAYLVARRQPQVV